MDPVGAYRGIGQSYNAEKYLLRYREKAGGIKDN